MSRMRCAAIGMIVVLGCGGGGSGVDVDDPPGDGPPPVTPPPRWQAFSLEDLKAQRQQQNVGFLEFLSESSLRMGLYHLGTGAQDNQDAHGQDEVYYIAGGSAKIRIDGVNYDAEAGSVFFVKAQVDHRFHSITEDLDVLVVFATAPSFAGDPKVLAFTADDMVTPRDPSQNVWNPFLQVGTMSLGMYMLPMAVGGDGVLTHTFDEINIVVSGTSSFVVDGDRVDIGPGSVVYVEDRTGHTFSGLSDDVDVLILWER